jgi:hypothetical protein
LEAALWEAIVELAEVGHDLAVTAQAQTSPSNTPRLERLAEDIAQLCRAAEAAGRRTKPS